MSKYAEEIKEQFKTTKNLRELTKQMRKNKNKEYERIQKHLRKFK